MSDRIIGVDVGGTKIAAAALEGGVLGEVSLTPTETHETDRFLDQLAGIIAGHGQADAVGIAVPSVVDFETGTARFSVNVPLQHVPLRAVLSERCGGVPVFVDNDATCAALAEALGDDMQPIASVVVMITVGTGVGGGVVLNGRIFRGATGAAPELGHMIIAADVTKGAPPTPERFPHPDALESWAAGRELDELGQERGIGKGPEVVRRAKEGDPDSVDAIRIVGERLGVGIANVMNLFDPDLIVIGGGVSTAGELLTGPAEEVARRLALPGVGTKTRIELARHGVEAGVRGASLLAAQELQAMERTP
ncbi:MAG TPA: ROK family protein [Solirubrobacteraceae bacterium]|nr:ROK family protein [Solirubrobacteraceae bacterium]